MIGDFITSWAIDVRGFEMRKGVDVRLTFKLEPKPDDEPILEGDS